MYFADRDLQDRKCRWKTKRAENGKQCGTLQCLAQKIETKISAALHKFCITLFLRSHDAERHLSPFLLDNNLLCFEKKSAHLFLTVECTSSFVSGFGYGECLALEKPLLRRRKRFCRGISLRARSAVGSPTKSHGISFPVLFFYTKDIPSLLRYLHCQTNSLLVITSIWLRRTQRFFGHFSAKNSDWAPMG